MGLIRLITFLLVGWIAWTMYRRFMAAASKDSGKKRLPEKHFVQCSYCDVHLPEQDAVSDGKAWFCSKAHQQAWLEKS